PRTLALRGIPRAHPGPDRRVRQRELEQLAADTLKRGLEVLLDVVRQRLQRRDVQYARLVRQRVPLERIANEIVDHGEERGERLAGAGRRRDQRRRAALDRIPCALLHRGGRIERAVEPARDGRVKSLYAHERLTDDG